MEPTSSLPPFDPVSRVAAKPSASATVAQPAAVSSAGASLAAAPVKFSPRPGDQVAAITDVLNGFRNEDRGQLILPCGTGKTLTSLWIKEGMKKIGVEAKLTLKLVPSIALIKQTKDAWLEQKTDDFDYLCVCSDKKVNALDEDDVDSEILAQLKAEAAGKVTTESDKVQEFLQGESKGDQGKVVFATYQSLPKVIEALKDTRIEFDLTIADEAHKTTGAAGNLFTMMHDNAALPSKKRLYMTATPKVHSAGPAEKGESGDYEYADMSNREIYGPEFHRMTFAKAIEQNILTDYEIVAVGINKSEIKARYPERNNLNDSDVLEELAHNIALEKVMTKHKASHALTFHSTIYQANEFQERHQALFPQVHSYSISSRNNVGQRKEILDEFAGQPNSERSVISNARCLT